ncbi:ABC transporter permease [Sphingosinicella sp. BN140058]|uniref:ABC transporter permease n=1 Tax=Sphingosinicella sp. BN140058 TaxID=1892855 RepID=UPI001012E752|nr:ABC transporter permease [Sphingosinicella sp. BN140058]QAY76820.1 FtsX-like permease family protein [Sphingosinicella sp. BN140058]
MWRNYLTVGFRALAKNKTYAFINIVGLAIGLAACLMILLFVRYETSYDGWMEEADRAYQFQDFYKATDNGGEEMALQMSSYVSGKTLVKDFPQIEKAVYVASAGATILQNGIPSVADRFNFVDGNLFDILQVPFARGDRAQALSQPNSLVLTETEAEKRFPNQNPMGRTLTLVSQGRNIDYVVTGVMRDLPKNSHVDLGVVARFAPESFFAEQQSFLTSWGNQGGWWYVKLRPGASAEEINRQLPAWEKRNIPDDTGGGEKTNPGNTQDWRLTNVRDVHLGKAQQASMTPGNDMRTIGTFGVVALLILGMAVVNFTNLATARASQRAREVALRKVLGASRRQLIVQFLGESMLVTTIAMVLALALVELLLRPFNAFLDADIALTYWGADGVLLPVLLLLLAVGAIGGLYPAFYLSRFQPARVLKANKSAAEAGGTGQLRNVLVVAQFAVSIGLIICTAVIYAQTLYARTADAGYKRDGLLQLQGVGAREVQPVAETLKHEIGRIEGVESASLTGIGVAPGNNSVSSVYLPGQSKGIDLGVYTIDHDFFPTMGMKMLAGRNFSERIAMDDSTTPFPVDASAEQALARRGTNIVVSESAARRLGFRDPQQAIGKPISVGLTLPEYGLSTATIVGVVQDARFRSIRDPLQPIMFLYAHNGFNAMVVRYNDPEPKRVSARVEGVWKRMLPTVPYRAEFADDRVKRLYEQDEARGRLFGAFAILAVVIGCLGLFGLAAFTAERRTKEIGIRKVLGARTRDIVRLLAWQFSKPVIIANLIAWPIAWWVMRDWLNGFDARIGLGPTPFLLAGLLALVIALGTIASHAFKVARANPIQALRYE